MYHGKSSKCISRKPLHGRNIRIGHQTSSDITKKMETGYVDDVFAITKKKAVSTFHEILNSIDPHIPFTIKHEQNGQIAYLNTLISNLIGTITIDIYRKPMHIDKYLDFTSFHDKKHKRSTAETLTQSIQSTFNGRKKNAGNTTCGRSP